ncbi:MAG: sigma-54 dependent transcriptional regulator [Spirochaetes bacterium]|nr:sigma-54 dependent transcriptional regulator [Spirochaetota bacterium]
MNPILIIDDEEGIRNVLSDILVDEGYSALTAPDGLEGLRLLKIEVVEMIFLDVWMPQMGGLEALQKIRELYPELPVIMISGHGTIDMAVKAIKSGAMDFIEKPLSYDRVLTIVQNVKKISDLKKENRELKNNLFFEDRMIGESKPLKKIRTIIEQCAPSDSRVLILGENGTGKELVAREIHHCSNRSQKPFVEVNCAAIPESLIESELFGHEKGAFTSAVSRRKGKFELADGGTLFLDEVADMSLQAQAKVLRVTQEMRFERIGGEESLSVDVRILCATNKNLQQEVAEGRFREDLFFRLNVIPITVPPLRDRVEDIPLLVEYFLNKFAQKQRIKPLVFDVDALSFIQTYPWAGNIRELKNYLERLCIMSDEPRINLEVAKTYLGEVSAEKSPCSDLEKYLDLPLNTAKDAFEKAFIEEKFKQNEYNMTRTAHVLGLYPSNLHSKLKKFGIEGSK